MASYQQVVIPDALEGERFAAYEDGT